MNENLDVINSYKGVGYDYVVIKLEFRNGMFLEVKRGEWNRFPYISNHSGVDDLIYIYQHSGDLWIGEYLAYRIDTNDVIKAIQYCLMDCLINEHNERK